VHWTGYGVSLVNPLGRPADKDLQAMAGVPVFQVLVVTATTALACAASRTPQTAPPAELAPLPGAQSVQAGPAPDRANAPRVTYTLNEPFPASATLAALDAMLRRRGLTAAPTSTFDPDRASSHALGWSAGARTRRGQRTAIHSWVGDWRDTDGRVVEYALFYESPLAGDAPPAAAPATQTLHVQGELQSAAMANAMAAYARQDGPAPPGDSLSEIDADVFTAIVRTLPLGAGPGEPPIALVARSRPICAGGASAGCIPDRVLAATDRPSQAAALRSRNESAHPTPAVSISRSINVASFAASKTPVLWCSLPGYALGQALVICSERTRGGGTSTIAIDLPYRAGWNNSVIRQIR
jgi:hypothetical protein